MTELNLNALCTEATEILVKDVADKLRFLDEMESKHPDWWTHYAKEREKIRTENGALIYMMGVLYYKKSKEEESKN